MHVFWGILTAVIGFAMFIGGLTKSEFFLYRMIVGRSKILWGKNVHKFHQVVGGLVTTFGILMILEVIPA